MALAHKDIEFASIVISYEDRTPVEKVSGQSLVPVLVDGDEVIADSMAIVAHLEERRPSPPLYPVDPSRRAELDVFVDWFDHVYKREPNAIRPHWNMATRRRYPRTPRRWIAGSMSSRHCSPTGRICSGTSRRPTAVRIRS